VKTIGRNDRMSGCYRGRFGGWKSPCWVGRVSKNGGKGEGVWVRVGINGKKGSREKHGN